MISVAHRGNPAWSVALAGFAGCVSPAPTPEDAGAATASPAPITVPQDAVPQDTASHDTYVEGSQRVWEAARERGLMFRGVGQEPGWVVEIGEGRITLVTDYGSNEVVTPAPQPVVDAASGTTWDVATEGNDVRIEFREEVCTDTMSGERFSMTVSVVLNGIRYDGCGRRLDRLP
jgi:uncharacterized membrane protein